MTDRPLRLHPFQAGSSFYFRLVAANGEIVAQSEGYTTSQARDDTIALIAHGHIIVEANGDPEAG